MAIREVKLGAENVAYNMELLFPASRIYFLFFGCSKKRILTTITIPSTTGITFHKLFPSNTIAALHRDFLTLRMGCR